MKRKILALVCALLLLCALLPTALGAESMYFLAVNDKMIEYSADTMPIVNSGTVYVPYTTFIAEKNGGVNLGVFYGRDPQLNTISLYGKQKPIITFDIAKGITYDTMDNLYPYRALIRNNTVYLPAWAVCNYFELEYSYLATNFGPLIRIKNEGGYYLDDRFFVSSATDKFREQKKQFDRDQRGEETPAPKPTSSPVDPAVPGKKQIRVFFAFRCDSGEGPVALLDQLEGEGGKALFFFRPQDLARWDDQIRRLLAQGHRIGFLVDGPDAATCQEQAEEGNRLLAHIARTSTDFLLVDGSSALRKELATQGWACWTSHVSSLSYAGARPSTLATALQEGVDRRTSSARVLMDDSSTSSQALGRLLTKMDTKDYLIRQIAESDL